LQTGPTGRKLPTSNHWTLEESLSMLVLPSGTPFCNKALKNAMQPGRTGKLVHEP
jgi:hypothetical protein